MGKHVQYWWVSCPTMTVCVKTVDGIIRESPAIVKKFKGQRLENLTRWFDRRFGSYELKNLDDIVTERVAGYRTGG